MNNLKEIKTTVTGLIIWIATGIYFVAPYIAEKELWETTHWEVSAGFISGLLLILAPDKFLSFVFGWLERKTK